MRECELALPPSKILISFVSTVIRSTFMIGFTHMYTVISKQTECERIHSFWVIVHVSLYNWVTVEVIQNVKL